MPPPHAQCPSCVHLQVASPLAVGGWGRIDLDKARAAGAGAPFLLRTTHSGLQLQGQLLPVNANPSCSAAGAAGLLAFVGAPRVAGLAELEAHGLVLADLPPASLAADVPLLGDLLARAEVRMHGATAFMQCTPLGRHHLHLGLRAHGLVRGAACRPAARHAATPRCPACRPAAQ
jgi:hypothetical protein